MFNSSGVLAANRNAPYQLRPFLYKCPQDDRIIIQFSRRLATGFPDRPRSPAIPPLTEAQAEAIDALHFLSEKHCLTMKLRTGDIQYVSNLGLFHAREGFVDSPQNKSVHYFLNNILNGADITGLQTPSTQAVVEKRRNGLADSASAPSAVQQLVQEGAGREAEVPR